MRVLEGPRVEVSVSDQDLTPRERRVLEQLGLLPKEGGVLEIEWYPVKGVLPAPLLALSQFVTRRRDPMVPCTRDWRPPLMDDKFLDFLEGVERHSLLARVLNGGVRVMVSSMGFEDDREVGRSLLVYIKEALSQIDEQDFYAKEVLRLLALVAVSMGRGEIVEGLRGEEYMVKPEDVKGAIEAFDRSGIPGLTGELYSLLKKLYERRALVDEDIEIEVGNNRIQLRVRGGFRIRLEFSERKLEVNIEDVDKLAPRTFVRGLSYELRRHGGESPRLATCYWVNLLPKKRDGYPPRYEPDYTTRVLAPSYWRVVLTPAGAIALKLPKVRVATGEIHLNALHVEDRRLWLLREWVKRHGMLAVYPQAVGERMPELTSRFIVDMQEVLQILNERLEMELQKAERRLHEVVIPPELPRKVIDAFNNSKVPGLVGRLAQRIQEMSRLRSGQLRSVGISKFRPPGWYRLSSKDSPQNRDSQQRWHVDVIFKDRQDGRQKIALEFRKMHELFPELGIYDVAIDIVRSSDGEWELATWEGRNLTPYKRGGYIEHLSVKLVLPDVWVIYTQEGASQRGLPSTEVWFDNSRFYLSKRRLEGEGRRYDYDKAMGDELPGLATEIVIPDLERLFTKLDVMLSREYLEEY